jgi:hypothetical protein
LKWYWWRFNGYGYFWGMVCGIASCVAFLVAPHVAHLFLPELVFPELSALNQFPIILAVSLLAAIIATLATKPEDDEVLKKFYRLVRPWGFWGPIKDKVIAEDPSFQPNPDFLRDMFNVVIGIAWQTSLVALPIYVVIRNYNNAGIALGIILVTSATLKFTWYDHLKKIETEMARPVATVPAPAAG